MTRILKVAQSSGSVTQLSIVSTIYVKRGSIDRRARFKYWTDIRGRRRYEINEARDKLLVCVICNSVNSKTGARTRDASIEISVRKKRESGNEI